MADEVGERRLSGQCLGAIPGIDGCLGGADPEFFRARYLR